MATTTARVRACWLQFLGRFADVVADSGQIEFSQFSTHIWFMKPLRISEDVVPIAKFKAHAARLLARAAATGQPIVITRNGEPAGVVLSPAEFDRYQERERFLASVEAGLNDVRQGRTVSTAELKGRLATRRRQRKL